MITMVRGCSLSRHAILCLSSFTLLLTVILMYTIAACNDESLLHTFYNQLQNLRSKNSELKRIPDNTEITFQNSSNRLITFFVPGLPIIYVLTPTHTRLEQKAELTRLSHTLKLVKNIHWIIVEDSESKTDLVTTFLKQCGLSYTHLNAITSAAYKLTDPRQLKARGVAQRNAGIEWLRNNEFPLKHEGVLYFADDDNTYSLQLFEEMRYTSKVSVWPVGLLACLRYEGLIVENKKVVGFVAYWGRERPFAIDMAGFAVNLQLVLDHPKAVFSYDVKRGYQESTILTRLGITLDDLEPKANLCTEVLVWHTRTQKSCTQSEVAMKKQFGHVYNSTIEV